MSAYDDRPGMPGAPLPPQQPMQPPPYGYGYQYGPYRLRPRLFSTETKPFFLTSEFGVSLIAAIAIAITAASSHAFGAWRAWILITALVAAYSLSRGIAKAGTSSHASDPRDNVDLSRGHDDSTHHN